VNRPWSKRQVDFRLIPDTRNTGTVALAGDRPSVSDRHRQGNGRERRIRPHAREALGVAPSDISVGYADSDAGFNGTGPGGSRCTVMMTGAVIGGAQALRDKLLRITSHMMECAPEDLGLRDGAVGVKGVPGMQETNARSRWPRTTSD
jgi:CO/xanthine dehydrogenase Mo-binding subunit